MICRGLANEINTGGIKHSRMIGLPIGSVVEVAGGRLLEEGSYFSV